MNETEKRTILHLIAGQKKRTEKLPTREIVMQQFEKFLIARDTLRALAIEFEHIDEDIATSLHGLVDAITLA